MAVHKPAPLDLALWQQMLEMAAAAGPRSIDGLVMGRPYILGYFSYKVGIDRRHNWLAGKTGKSWARGWDAAQMIENNKAPRQI